MKDVIYYKIFFDDDGTIEIHNSRDRSDVLNREALVKKTTAPDAVLNNKIINEFLRFRDEMKNMKEA